MAKTKLRGRGRRAELGELRERVAVLEATNGIDEEHRKFPVAHILRPRGGVARAKQGEDVRSLCGAPISREPLADVPVCRDCFVRNLTAQEDEAAGWLVKAREEARAAGRTEGLAEGERESMRKIREAAEHRAGEQQLVKAS